MTVSVITSESRMLVSSLPRMMVVIRRRGFDSSHSTRRAERSPPGCCTA